MTDGIVVFIGPTLGREQASGLLDAAYLPPAEQGSVVRVVRSRRPRAVVLIDGAFGRVPAVRHKEILWALSQGIAVHGAASMGALRAAELAPFGMEGHGFIYRWYRLTPFADDDEVAVAMTPGELGGAALSEALINIRLTLRRGERQGVIRPDTRHAMERLARSIHFVDRSYPFLLDRARESLPPDRRADLDRLEGWLPGNAVDRKRADAVDLLRRLARDPSLLTLRSKPPAFCMTEAWAFDLEAAGLWPVDP